MEVWLFIFGYLIHFMASCILLLKIIKERSVYGLSLDMQICHLFSALSRCVWYFETRLIENPLAYIELICSLLASIVLVFFIWRYRYTHTKNTWTPLRAYFIIPLCILAAILFHPGRQWINLQVLVAFSIYVEAAALLPQLWLMRKMVEIEPLTSHYVGLLVISRTIRLFFWLTLFIQGEHFIGLFVADLLHSIFAADYFVLWCKKLRNGGILVYEV